MVSISSVKIAPDPLEADECTYEFFPGSRCEEALKKIQDKAGGDQKRIREPVRTNSCARIPEVKYFRDDTPDHVFRMEEIFKKISKKKNRIMTSNVLLEPSNFKS